MKTSIAGRSKLHPILAGFFGLLTIAVFAVVAVMLLRGDAIQQPLALAMVGIVSATYAGALRYLPGNTQLVGAKPAPVRVTRNARVTALRPAH